MDFLANALHSYCEQHTSPENELLHKINRETHLEVMRSRMLSGHLQGRFLSFITKMLSPRYILEIGTYTGYSAICLAEGLTSNGKLYTIEVNEELANRVKSYFEDAGLSSRIDLRIGNALEIIPQLDIKFDLVFIDADKPNYIAYYDLIIDKLSDKGVIIADNVLWSGKVIDESANDESSLILKQFNDKIQSDKRVENVLLPLRDGLMMVRKK